MRCNYAFLCDFAQEAGAGKINALGIGLASIQAATLPAKDSQMTFAASLSGTIAEAGMKKVELRLIDADGANVLPPLDVNLDFAVHEPALEGNLNLIFNLNGVSFPKYGQYAFHLVVQGNELARAPFSVIAPAATG